MKNPHLPTGILASILLAAATIQPASAQLPAIKDPPWLGYFAIFANKHYQFGVSSLGKITLTAFNEKGQPLTHELVVPIEITVQETQPDGKISVKKVQSATLTSTDAASEKFTKAVIKGKVTGDASFEVTIEQTRGLISMGGRLLDNGNLKNPLRFSIRATFSSAYAKVKKTEKQEEKSFEKRIKGDRIDLKWTDGKRKKQAVDEPVDASSKDINGPGIAAAEVEISAYKGNKFTFTASENSSMNLTNDKTAPLHEGFAVNWVPDSEKDKDGKARFSFEVK